MIDLFRSEDDARVGTITEEALDFLISNLEEEDTEDTDYYVDPDTIDFLKDQNPPAGLIDVLVCALGESEGVEIYYLTQDVEEPEAAGV